MPWQGTNAFDYNALSITANAPARSGVYAIFFAGANWVGRHPSPPSSACSWR